MTETVGINPVVGAEVCAVPVQPGGSGSEQGPTWGAEAKVARSKSSASIEGQAVRWLAVRSLDRTDRAAPQLRPQYRPLDQDLVPPPVSTVFIPPAGCGFFGSSRSCVGATPWSGASWAWNGSAHGSGPPRGARASASSRPTSARYIQASLVGPARTEPVSASFFARLAARRVGRAATLGKKPCVPWVRSGIEASHFGQTSVRQCQECAPRRRLGAALGRARWSTGLNPLQVLWSA